MMIRKSPITFLIAVLVSLSLACSSIAELSPTATPLPTATFTITPPPTSTPTPAGPVSTSGNPIAVSVGDLSLSNELYEHPSGFVSFYPMQGWDIEDLGYAVSMTDPKTGVNYYVNATNTGYELDTQGFSNFRAIMEEIYNLQDNYIEVDAGSNPGINLYYFEKTYTGTDGVDYYVYSIYQQFGSVIFTIELAGEAADVSADLTNPYRIMFDSFTQTINISSEIASEFPMYQQTWLYAPSDTATTLEVPWAWSFYPDSLDETYYYTYFTSPDNIAIVEFVREEIDNLTKDTGLEMSVEYLNILHSKDTNDIEINNFSEFQELEPGLFLYDWRSKTSGEAGTMLYDIRVAGKLNMVTVYVTDTDLLPLYAATLGAIGDSYKLEQ